MARTEKDVLLVELEARVRDFERGMAKASNTADRQFKKINQSAQKSAATMQQTMQGAVTRVNGVLGKLGLGGLAAGGIAGMVAGVSEIAKRIQSTGDAARKAGIDFKSFQQLAVVAKVNRIEVDSLADGLREMSLRGSEFANGGAGEGFVALGYNAEQVAQKLKKPSEFLTEIIGKLGQLSKADQINVADKIFSGTAAADFVRLVDQGAEGIRRTIAEGEALGQVLSDDVLAKANDLNEAIRVAGDTVGAHLKRAIVEAAWELARFLDSWREFKNQRSSTLEVELTSAGERRLALENEILALQNEQRENTSVFAGAENKIIDGKIAAKREELAGLAKTEAEILAILSSREAPSSATPLEPVKIQTDPSKGGGSRNTAISELERQREATDKLIASLRQELELVGATNVDRQIALTLSRAGVDALSAEGLEIAKTIRLIDEKTEALNREREAQDQLRNASEAAAGMVGDTLTSIVDGSMKAEDALKRLAVQMALALVQSALLGSGPFGGFFKIPKFAGGTSNAPGGLAVVGERGPELVNLPKGSQVTPAGPTRSMLNKKPEGDVHNDNSQNVSVNFAPVYNVQGSGPEIAELRRQMARDRAELPGRVVQAVQGARKRNVRV